MQSDWWAICPPNNAQRWSQAHLKKKEKEKNKRGMSIIIKGLNLPKKDCGEYFVHTSEVKDVEVGAVVMTLMIDQHTQGLRMSLWNPEKYGLKESYPCIEIEEKGKG